MGMSLPLSDSRSPLNYLLVALLDCCNEIAHVLLRPSLHSPSQQQLNLSCRISCSSFRFVPVRDCCCCRSARAGLCWEVFYDCLALPSVSYRIYYSFRKHITATIRSRSSGRCSVLRDTVPLTLGGVTRCRSLAESLSPSVCPSLSSTVPHLPSACLTVVCTSIYRSHSHLNLTALLLVYHTTLSTSPSFYLSSKVERLIAPIVFCSA